MDAIFLVVGAFICSKRDSKFIHLASQNRTSVIGPGYEFGMFNSSAESLLSTWKWSIVNSIPNCIYICDELNAIDYSLKETFLVKSKKWWWDKFKTYPNLVGLIGPLDNDPLNVVFKCHVTFFAFGFTNAFFFLGYSSCSLLK